MPGGRPTGEVSKHFVKFTDPADGKEKFRCEFCEKIYNAYNAGNFRNHLTNPDQKCTIPANVRQLLVKRPHEPEVPQSVPDQLNVLLGDFGDGSPRPSSSQSPASISASPSSRNT